MSIATVLLVSLSAALDLTTALGPAAPEAVQEWKHSGSIWLLTTAEGAELSSDTVIEQFPVLVRLHRDTFDFSQAGPQGEDIRFTTNTGEPLAFEIDHWDADVGTAGIWVRIPVIRGNARQEIRMQWGCPGARTESSGQAVFNASNGYLAVWHMNDPVKDSTGTLPGTDTGTESADGVIGRARHFSDHKGILGGEDLTELPVGTSSHTTEIWFRPERPNTTLIGWGNEQSQGKVVMQFRSPPHIRMDCYFSGGDIRGTSPVGLNQWTQVAYSYREGEARLYVNGELDATNIHRDGPLNIRNPARLYLGGWYNNYDFAGDIDEVRLSSVVRSAEWVRLQHENQKPNQTFVGLLVQPGTELTVSQSQVELGENESVTIEANAGGAQKVEWIERRDGRETVVATNRLSYTFQAGRIAHIGEQQKDSASTSPQHAASLLIRAIYPHEVKTKVVDISIRDDIPEPDFTLDARTTWDGRETIEVVPQILNREAMSACRQGRINVKWTIDGIAVIKRIEGEKLILRRAQGSGRLQITAAIDNGGAPMVRSITMDVAEPRPSREPWMSRPVLETEHPENGQFVACERPRIGGPGFGQLFCTGKLEAGVQADAVFLRVYADEKLITTETSAVGADGRYSLAARIQPGLIKYRTEFGMRSGDTETILQTARDVVCGDVYLICGQSNAVATDFGADNPLQASEWVRTFGSATGDPVASRTKLWAYAEARSNQEQAQIGYWGMELGRKLVESEKIPICIINGAVGGTRIDQHQRNDDDPMDASTIYGRLLWRVHAARLTHGVRAIIWHQGENDQGADGPTGTYGYETYRQYFVDLAASWKEDYPNLHRYYVFQIWPKACAMGINGSDDRLREVQRTLPQMFSNLSVISTLGIKPPGGCHFPAAGYAEFANYLHPMMRYQLYHRFVNSFNSPNLARVYFATPQSDEITLEFDGQIEWRDTLISEFYLDGEPDQIVSGIANGHLLTLKLRQSTASTKITYIDSDHWNPENLLIGRNGLAALTFCEVPIEKYTAP